MKVKVFEKTEKGVVEHEMWSVDANELVNHEVDKGRWSLSDPRVKADKKADAKA